MSTLRLTKEELVSLLSSKSPNNSVQDQFGTEWYLSSVEREDGSGMSFNLYLRASGGRERTVYCRIIDATPIKQLVF